MKNPCRSCVVASCCTELCQKKKVFNYIALGNASCYSGKHPRQKLVKTLRESREIMLKKYPGSMFLKRDLDDVVSILLKKKKEYMVYHIYFDKMMAHPLDLPKEERK